MHFANTSEILASLSDDMGTESTQTEHLFDLLIYQPDPEEIEDYLSEIG